MSFDPISNPVDFIVLGGARSPGIAEVIGAEAAREYAVRQPPFTTGARIVYKRRKLAEFSVKIRLYTPEDFAAWNEWRPLIDKLPAQRRQATALDIAHPQLEDLDIKAVVIVSVSQLEQTDHGEWTCTIKFLESRGLPKVTLAKVEGAKATPVDPIDLEIKGLANQVQELAK